LLRRTGLLKPQRKRRQQQFRGNSTRRAFSEDTESDGDSDHVGHTDSQQKTETAPKVAAGDEDFASTPAPKPATYAWHHASGSAAAHDGEKQHKEEIFTADPGSVFARVVRSNDPSSPAPGSHC